MRNVRFLFILFFSAIVALGTYVYAGNTASIDHNTATNDRSTATYVKQCGSPADDVVLSLVQSSDYSVLLAGYTTGFSAQGKDILLTKKDFLGREMQSVVLGGSGDDIARDVVENPAGGYVVVGQTTSAGAGNTDAFIMLLDGELTLQSCVTVGSTWNDSARSIAVMPDNSFVIGGFSEAGPDDSNGLLIFADASGNLTGSYQLPAPGTDEIVTVNALSDGTIAVTGNSDSFTTGHTTGFCAKVNTTGTVTIARQYDTGQPMEFNSTREVESQNIAHAGKLWDSDQWNGVIVKAAPDFTLDASQMYHADLGSSRIEHLEFNEDSYIAAVRTPFEQGVEADFEHWVTVNTYLEPQSTVSTRTQLPENPEFLPSRVIVPTWNAWITGSTAVDAWNALEMTWSIINLNGDMEGCPEFADADSIGNSTPSMTATDIPLSSSPLSLTGIQWTPTDSIVDMTNRTICSNYDRHSTLLTDDNQKEIHSISWGGSSNAFLTGHCINWSSPDNSDSMLVKVDERGNVLWGVTTGGPGDEELVSTTRITNNEAISVGHTTSHGSGLADALLTRFDSTGNLVWSKAVGGSNVDRAVAVTPFEDHFAAFINSSSFSVQDGILVVEFDNSGAILDTHHVATNEAVTARDVKTTNDGFVVICGDIWNSSTSTYDGLLMEFDSNFNLVWCKQINVNENLTFNSLLSHDDRAALMAAGILGIGAGSSGVIVNAGDDGTVLDCTEITSPDGAVGIHTIEWTSTDENRNGRICVAELMPNNSRSTHSLIFESHEIFGSRKAQMLEGDGEDILVDVRRNSNGSFTFAGSTTSSPAVMRDILLVQTDPELEVPDCDGLTPVELTDSPLSVTVTDVVMTATSPAVDSTALSWTSEVTSLEAVYQCQVVHDCERDGDVNGDGSVTAEDAQQAFTIVLGLLEPTAHGRCAADCNGSDTITAEDAQTIFLQVLGLGSCID